MREGAPSRRSNQFRYTIETRSGRVLGGASDGAIAFAMYYAAVAEHLGQSVELKSDGEVLASAQ